MKKIDKENQPRNRDWFFYVSDVISYPLIDEYKTINKNIEIDIF